MKSRKHTGGFRGKGYYIALILCAAAIGISGYVYYRNANHEEDPQIQNPTSDVDVMNPTDQNVQAVATQPGTNTPIGNEQTGPAQGSVQKVLKTGMPVAGETIHGYAMDCLSYNETTRDWRVHNGIDIAAEAGTEVLAAADGTVYTVYVDETMGTTVVIRHQDGYVTTYSSLNADLSVASGDTVTLGQKIGTVANTAMLETALGDHIHFSVTHNDKPMDPADFFALN